MNNRQHRRAEVQRKPRFQRYYDLQADGIVLNRMTLSRWIKDQGFPKAVRLGPNTVAWKTEEVEAWLAARGRSN